MTPAVWVLEERARRLAGRVGDPTFQPARRLDDAWSLVDLMLAHPDRRIADGFKARLNQVGLAVPAWMACRRICEAAVEVSGVP